MCSIHCSHHGNALACGNEAGELVILSPSAALPSSSPQSTIAGAYSWNITFKRSIGPKAHAPTLHKAIMTGRPLYKKAKNFGSTNHDNRRSKKSPRNSSTLQVSKYSELTCLAFSPDGKIYSELLKSQSSSRTFYLLTLLNHCLFWKTKFWQWDVEIS